MSGQHGTNAGYEAGCRCDLCRRAKADYQSRWRKQRSHADASRVERCPTCGNPAYRRASGYEQAVSP